MLDLSRNAAADGGGGGGGWAALHIGSVEAAVKMETAISVANLYVPWCGNQI